MEECTNAAPNEVSEPFKRTPEGQLLVGELELLRLLTEAEARRAVTDESEQNATDAK